MSRRALKLAPCLLACMVLTVGASAAESKTGDLKALRARIADLQRELAKSTESKANVTDRLRATETAISVANRSLHQLAEQRAQVSADLAKTERQAQGVTEQIALEQQQLSRLVYRQGTSGGQDALTLLLGGSDPNQAARDGYYLLVLSHAKAQLLGELRTALDQKQQLADAARAKADQLTDIGRRQEQNRADLLAQQKQHQQVLAGIAETIKAQRHQIDILKANEARLTKLIEGLARIHRKAPRHAAKPDQPALSNQETPEPSSFHGAFASLRGKLRLPVRGDIVNRFGTLRGEGGMTWKGLFIRAAEGTEVRAVAPGRVVFADWLRGFGNLMILDHGDGYLSIYGNNQSLLRETGDIVAAGDAVAAVGNSGGNPESGLYFELRQQGQPVDPLKWAVLH